VFNAKEMMTRASRLAVNLVQQEKVELSRLHDPNRISRLNGKGMIGLRFQQLAASIGSCSHLSVPESDPDTRLPSR
jgi:hypothetical protein